MQLLLGYVQSGRALAYLPDFAVREHDVLSIELADAVACSEQVLLVWDGALAGQWLHAVAGQLSLAATIGSN